MGEYACRSATFDTDHLKKALAQIPEDAWSLPSTFAETQVHHGYRRVVLVSAGRRQPRAELFDFVWAALDPVRDSWLSWIDPGGFIIPHRDGGPWWERWQVPIATSGEWLTDESFTPTNGEAFPVQHWETHAVTNRGATPRIHLVVDRDVAVERKPLPFQTFQIPNEMADLVERSQL